MEQAETHEERDRYLRRWASRGLAALDVRVAVTGLEHAAVAAPHLVLPLHESLVDGALLLGHLPAPMTFVARDELADEEPFTGLLRASRQILIKPESPGSMRTVIRETALLRAQGRSVVMFPQGSVLGIETAFRRGGYIVAEQLQMPVLPVVIAGSHRVWERPFSPLVRRGEPVYLEVLEPRRLTEPADYLALEREMKTAAAGNGWAAPRHFVPERDGYWDGYSFEIDAANPELAERIRRRGAERASMETAAKPSP